MIIVGSMFSAWSAGRCGRICTSTINPVVSQLTGTAIAGKP
jgi:hypothetical protein